MHLWGHCDFELFDSIAGLPEALHIVNERLTWVSSRLEEVVLEGVRELRAIVILERDVQETEDERPRRSRPPFRACPRQCSPLPPMRLR